jgi:peptidyl-prolyl cis-trans isomerase B (cyclophilin B)
MKSLILQSAAAICITLSLGTLPRATLAQAPPFELPVRVDLLKLRSAELETNKGTITFELFPEDAPWHVANFKYLADKGFYRGLKFHLYEPGYLVQGGDPLGNGKGGAGYTLPPEFSSRNHRLGTLGMARKPDVFQGPTKEHKNLERESSGSQFRIFLNDARHMDGKFTIFGKVVDGFSVLKTLRKDDIIVDLRVYVRQEGGR